MKWISLVFVTVTLPFFSQQTQWLVKNNWLLNPGAEANSDQKPQQWKTDFPGNSENDWVSDYGRMSHEWNHGSLKGLPPSPGNNYFRFTVNNEPRDRKVNIYQEFSLTNISKDLAQDTVLFVFSGQVASHYTLKENCTYTAIKLLFYNEANEVIDSSIIRKTPADFRYIEEEGVDEADKGHSALHEFQPFRSSKEVPKTTHKVRIELYCEFPCFVKNEEDESEGSVFNTFFFDNLYLGFYRK
jgi:hypothetical protein